MRSSRMRCALCRKRRRCGPREIERQEYDICAQCWKALESKLRGKGRARRSREVVLLPPVQAPKEAEPIKPLPGYPPTIWGTASRLN